MMSVRAIKQVSACITLQLRCLDMLGMKMGLFVWIVETLFVWLLLMAGANLLREKSTASWLVAGADLV